MCLMYFCLSSSLSLSLFLLCVYVGVHSDYSNATDLHIAVTTSGGDIVEFDRHGLQRHRRDDNPCDWWQSLLVGDLPEPWYDYWDEMLEQVSVAFRFPQNKMQISKPCLCQICAQTERWSIARYEESSHNCYTFVLAFLQALGHAQLSDAARTKTSFCEKYIVPRTTTAGKYISLYRKLRLAGIYVHRQQAKQPKHRSLKVDVCDGLNGGHKVPNTKLLQQLGARNPTRQKLCTIKE